MQAGRAEVRAVIERARERRQPRARATIFFLDEIHRFNKAQQDALLPAVEDGLVTLIGATTENPYFEVNSALLSRTPRLRARGAVGRADVRVLLDRAVARGEVRGAGADRRRGARVRWPSWTRGDARAALNALELAGESPPGRTGRVTLEAIADALQRRALQLRPSGRQPLRHDLGLDQGDPRLRPGRVALLPRGDARGRRGPALHRPADGDPRLRGHRQRRPAGARGGDRGGGRRRARRPARVPSSRSPRPRSTCRSRRSRTPSSGRSWPRASYVREHGAEPPPAYLRSSTRSEGEYDYPHAAPGHVSPQELLPTASTGARFYEPDDAEAALRDRLDEIRTARGARCASTRQPRRYPCSGRCPLRPTAARNASASSARESATSPACRDMLADAVLHRLPAPERPALRWSSAAATSAWRRSRACSPAMPT